MCFLFIFITQQMDPSEDDPGPVTPGSSVTGQLTKAVLVCIYKDNDYIDCDITTTVQEYDKFQVHVATVVTLQVIPIQPPQMENIQVSTAVKLTKSFIPT